MNDSRHSDCAECPFLDRTIENGCPGDRTGTLIPDVIYRDFKAGEPVFDPGDPISGIYCVRSGSILLTGGREQAVAVVPSGDVLGMPDILGGTVHRNGALAYRPASACFIPRERALELVKADPSIMVRIMRKICERIRLMEQQVEG